jgi:hypothetical protein
MKLHTHTIPFSAIKALRMYVACVCVCAVLTPLALVGAAPVRQSTQIFPTVSRYSHSATVATSSPTIGIFTVTFTIVAYKEDVFIGKNSFRQEKYSSENTSTLPRIVYNIYESDHGVHTRGIERSFTFSDAEDTGALYRIKKGTAEDITLVVLYQNKGTEADEYRIGLTSIGYTLRTPTNSIIELQSNVGTVRTSEVSLKN